MTPVTDFTGPAPPPEAPRPPDGSAPPTPAPSPSGPVDRDAAAVRIAEIRADLSHPFHKGNPAALREMSLLYETVYGSAPAASGATVATALDYEVPMPPGRTPDTFTPVDQAIATAACRGFNLSESEASPVVNWILDASQPKPAVAEGLRSIPSPSAAAESLRNHWGMHYPKQMAQARAAFEILDQRRGGRPGELKEEFDRTKAGNHPAVIKEFAKLGALLARDPEASRLIAKYESEYREAYTDAQRRVRRDR